MLTDNRLRSLKRRYAVLREHQLDFYRTAKNFARNEAPSLSLALAELSAVTRVTSKGGHRGFQIANARDTWRYCGESDRATEAWIGALSAALRTATLNELAARPAPPTAALVAGYVRVR